MAISTAVAPASEKKTRVSAGGDVAHELLGALDGGGGGQAQQGGVGHPVELGPHRRVDLRHPVAVDVAPERGDAVEVAAPEGVDEVDAVGRVDDERVLLQPPLPSA